MTDLSSLISRVEEGEGWDSCLDKDILRHFGFTWRGMDYWSADNRQIWKGETCFTAKLDAVVSLIEQKLPGWGYMLNRYETPRGMQSRASLLSPPDSKYGDTFDIWGASSPRALLAACLRALSALEDSPAGLADATSKGPQP